MIDLLPYVVDARIAPSTAVLVGEGRILSVLTRLDLVVSPSQPQEDRK